MKQHICIFLDLTLGRSFGIGGYLKKCSNKTLFVCHLLGPKGCLALQTLSISGLLKWHKKDWSCCSVLCCCQLGSMSANSEKYFFWSIHIYRATNMYWYGKPRLFRGQNVIWQKKIFFSKILKRFISLNKYKTFFLYH